MDCQIGAFWPCLVHLSKIIIVKLWFTNLYCVDFSSVSNLIVILFNPLYTVFVVGIYCKGCVIVRESVKTQAIEEWSVFVVSSRLSIPRSNSYALHMLECEESGQMETAVSREYLAGKAFLRDILFCQPVQSDTHFLCLHYLYPHNPQMRRRASERKP